MKALIYLFWQICTFRKGPQDVPYSPPLLGLLVVALVVLSLLLTAYVEPAYFTQRFAGSVVAIALWFVVVYALLSVKKLIPRFLQTITACLGTDLLISMLSLPLQLLLISAPKSGMYSSLIQSLLLSLVIWDIVIKGRIYDSAMGLGRFGGNALAVALWIMLLMVSLSFLPAEAIQQK